MRAYSSYWPWAALILFVALLANGRSLPWPITALAFCVAGGYLLTMAWRAWGFGGGRATRDTRNVTYWRGQRIERPGPQRRARPVGWSELAPVVLYGLLGVALILAAVLVVVSRSGLMG